MDYDVLIIGSGPAGQHAAWQAARMGKRAAIIERKPRIGGAGLQTGTIPNKAMREVAYLVSRSGYGGMRHACVRHLHRIAASVMACWRMRCGARRW